ncbi:uncharacterized protein LOC106450057 isoform X5 [Brassica napus]|uniref:uncharacterized protein LOC106450057 isoform X5 n=1 Tax=Brassica napus TaxID=3708 RepID=UPI0006AADC90|nr:uncharacterized protein LOC106450057 isoform X5 [Brassica napus]
MTKKTGEESSVSLSLPLCVAPDEENSLQPTGIEMMWNILNFEFVKRELRGIEEQRKMMRREAGEVRRRRKRNLTSTTDQVHRRSRRMISTKRKTQKVTTYMVAL